MAESIGEQVGNAVTEIQSTSQSTRDIASFVALGSIALVAVAGFALGRRGKKLRIRVNRLEHLVSGLETLMDINIEAGRVRVRRQISLIRELRRDGHSTLLAREILQGFLESNRVMRQIRNTAHPRSR